MSAQEAFASSIGSVVTDYLALKEALGRRYAVERDVLMHLDRFLAAWGPDAPDLTAETFASWCASQEHLTTGVRRNRMRIVRNLCLYRQRSWPSCFVPDPSGFPPSHAPRPPHIFAEQEIARLLHAADGLRPSATSPLPREVFRLSVVLLYTAGLRRGELVRLTLADYEPTERTLLIRASKFHKSRVVPLSRDAARELDAYLQARRLLSNSDDGPLLCSRRRGLRAYTGAGIGEGLRRLFRTASVRTASGQMPRVHDLRHSFAVHALLRWYRAGIDVQAKLPSLATYMGHVSIVSTQYYLSFIEPLSHAASDRFARHCQPFLSTSPLQGGGP
jgi:integrase/recombinase XerD